jgi:N-ethylmaleimide reductase
LRCHIFPCKKAEATQVSPQGKGYAFTPGIHSAAQLDGWRLVTDVVHAAGGRIYLQLWYVGRISRPELQPDGALPVAPSAVKPEGAMTFIDERSGLIIEVVEDSFQGNAVEGHPETVIRAIRENFQGAYIANANYAADEARQRIKAGQCDLVSFGRPFISNPDLPERFRRGAELNRYDEKSFYGGDEHGDIDYPALD